MRPIRHVKVRFIVYLFRDEGTRYAVVIIDLKNASRDELIRLVVMQHETIAHQERIIADLHATVARLEGQVTALTARVGTLVAALEAATREGDGTGSGRPPGMPGLKSAQATPPAAKRERKRREQACVRRRMEPTARRIHALDRCPTCGERLTGGSIKRRREVIEIPVVPAAITAHVFVERWCARCRARHTPRVDLVGEVVGKQRFGVGLSV